MQAVSVLCLVEAPENSTPATVLVAALSLTGDLADEPAWTMEQLVQCWVAPEPGAGGAVYHD